MFCVKQKKNQAKLYYLVENMHPVRIPWTRDVFQYYTTFLKLTEHQVGVTRGKSGWKMNSDIRFGIRN